MSNPLTIEERLILDARHRAQTDPVWWMENGCGWKLWEEQKRISKALLCHERLAVPGCFGFGKTHLSARLALWWLSTHYPSKVITTAPTLRQVKDLLWSEIRAAHMKSKRPLGPEPMKLKIENDPEWYAVGFSTEADKIDQFTGYHSPHLLLIFDQAAGVDRSVWEAAEGLMTGGHARWLVISNTTDSTSVMSEVCGGPDREGVHMIGNQEFGPQTKFGKWAINRVTAYQTPNVVAGCDIIPGIISHDWIEKKREMWDPSDPMWQIFIEAMFVSASSMTILTNTMIKGMFECDLAPDWDNIVISCDVADEGLDSTVWYVKAGPRLLFIDQVYGNNPMQVADKTVDVWKRTKELTGFNPSLIRVDKIGVGSGVVARLQDLNYPTVGVNVSKSPLYDPEQFLNLRAEMGWSVRKLAEKTQICMRPLYPTPPQFLDFFKEEATVRYKILGSGKIQMERKDDIRKRLRRSPDFFDAMMLAFGDVDEMPRVTLAAPNDPKFDALAGIKDGELITLDQAVLLQQYGGRIPTLEETFMDFDSIDDNVWGEPVNW